jgi:hypothetical protein
MAKPRRDTAMRARVPITIGGLSVAASLVVSAVIGSSGITVVVCCLALLAALAFGIWVLSANDRTERLVSLIQAIRGSGGKTIGPGGKTIEKRGREN